MYFWTYNKINKTMTSFETEYQLREFREVQPQYFDQDGKAYTGSIFNLDMAESMIRLINQLEAEIFQCSENNQTH